MTDEAWINTVRLARDFGTVAELYPPGVISLTDLPFRLFDDILEATMRLGVEELPEDEQPSERLWHDREALNEHMRDVAIARRAKYGVGAGAQIEGDTSDNQAGLELQRQLGI